MSHYSICLGIGLKDMTAVSKMRQEEPKYFVYIMHYIWSKLFKVSVYIYRNLEYV